MELIWLALVTGALAFPHCLGMCGGFALHLAGGDSKRIVLRRQLLWHLGRTMTYMFLGALAGAFGCVISLAHWSAVKAVPAYLAGVIMVIMGLSVLGLLPARKRGTEDAHDEGLLGSLLGRFFQRPSSGSALVLGLATGFLPCPITIGLLGLAADSASVPMGIGIMAAMGLGTTWALLILGMTGHAIEARWRKWGIVVVGVLLIVMGTWTILRKAHVLPPLPGMHALPKASSCCMVRPGRP